MEKRRLENISMNLRGSKFRFEPITPIRHFTPVLVNYARQDDLRRTFWSSIPPDCKIRADQQNPIDYVAAYANAFAAMSLARFNAINPYGRRIFDLSPSTATVLSGFHQVPVIESMMMKLMSVDQLEGLYPLPANIPTGPGDIVTVLARDDDIRYSTGGGPLQPVPPAGIPVDEVWITNSVFSAQRLTMKLALRRKDLVTEFELTRSVDGMDRAALVAYDGTKQEAWSRFEVTSDSIYLGVVFGFGEDVDDVGVRLPVDQSKWTAPIQKPLAITRLVAHYVTPGNG